MDVILAAQTAAARACCGTSWPQSLPAHYRDNVPDLGLGQVTQTQHQLWELPNTYLVLYWGRELLPLQPRLGVAEDRGHTLMVQGPPHSLHLGTGQSNQAPGNFQWKVQSFLELFWVHWPPHIPSVCFHQHWLEHSHTCSWGKFLTLGMQQEDDQVYFLPEGLYFCPGKGQKHLQLQAISGSEEMHSYSCC